VQFPIKALAEAGFGRDLCVQEALRVLEVRILYDLKWRNRLTIQAGVYLMGKHCNYRSRDELITRLQVYPTSTAYWKRAKSFVNGRTRMTLCPSLKSSRAT
jgi:hypothetical protein